MLGERRAVRGPQAHGSPCNKEALSTQNKNSLAPGFDLAFHLPLSLSLSPPLPLPLSFSHHDRPGRLWLPLPNAAAATSRRRSKYEIDGDGGGVEPGRLGLPLEQQTKIDKVLGEVALRLGERSQRVRVSNLPRVYVHNVRTCRWSNRSYIMSGRPALICCRRQGVPGTLHALISTTNGINLDVDRCSGVLILLK